MYFRMTRTARMDAEASVLCICVCVCQAAGVARLLHRYKTHGWRIVPGRGHFTQSAEKRFSPGRHVSTEHALVQNYSLHLYGFGWV